MRIDFHPSAEPTLGMEWEFALVDRRTRDLANDAAAPVRAAPRPRLPDPGRLHKELLRNTVEIVTGVCATVGDADGRPAPDPRGRRTDAGDALGLDLFGAGTHPFASGPCSSSPRGTATRS